MTTYFALSPCWCGIGLARLSCLVPPGVLVMQISTSEVIASFGNARWAVFGWPAKRLGTFDGTEYVRWDPEASKVRVKHVLDETDHAVLPFKTVSPLGFKLAGCGGGGSGIVVATCGIPIPFVAARIGKPCGHFPR